MPLNKKEANPKCRHSSLCPDVYNKSGWREGGTHTGEKLREEAIERPNSWTKSRQKSLEFSSVLFTATTAALL
jgi:hypothetical protein